MENTELHTYDFAMLEKYVRHQQIILQNNKTIQNTVDTGWVCELLPEDFMYELEKHIGDGLAKVTVGADLGVSDYGNKASSFISVTVTCGNNMGDIKAVHDKLLEYTQTRVTEDCNKLVPKLDQLLDNR